MSTELPTGFLPMAIYCIGIYFFTLVVRSVIEARWPAIMLWKGWRKLLRSMPVAFGGVGALIMHKYPFLDTLPTRGTRFIYGCFGGGVASFGYLIFKAVVQKHFGVRVEKGLGDTDTPPAMKSDAPASISVPPKDHE